MGTVYEATDTRLNAQVALKETLLTDKLSRRAFEREAQLLARLRHPVLPKVIDHFTENSGQFLVMEYIAGDDLATLMEKQGGRFPPSAVLPWVLRWGDQLLDALDHLHRQSPPVYHRDIKPQNLKLTSRGDIILLDFGLAKGGMTEASTMTARGEKLMGFTPNYAPLEQIRGSEPDARSDLYSLSATLYHLATGTKPPDALTRVAALLNDQPDPLRPAHEHNDYIIPPVSAVLQKALAPNMEERPASALEMRKLLQAVEAMQDPDSPLQDKASISQVGIVSALPASPATQRFEHDDDTSHAAPSEAVDFATRAFPVTELPAVATSEPAGTLLHTLQTGSAVLCLDLSRDGRLLAVGGDDHVVRIWDMHTLDMTHTLEVHEGGVTSLAFSPDGALLATGSEDKTVCLWRTGDGTLLHQSRAYSDPLESVVFSPNGKYLALGGWGNAIFMCRVEDDTLAVVTEIFSSFVHSLAFSPDGRTLAAGCYDAVIHTWQAETWNAQYDLTGHTSFVLTVAFGPNNKLLASGAGGTNIHLWRLSDGRMVDTLSGHNNFVRSVAFSPDNKLLASGSEDRSVRLWHTTDGACMCEMDRHTNGVTCVTFTPDSQIVISGSRDTKVRLWKAT